MLTLVSYWSLDSMQLPSIEEDVRIVREITEMEKTRQPSPDQWESIRDKASMYLDRLFTIYPQLSKEEQVFLARRINSFIQNLPSSVQPSFFDKFHTLTSSLGAMTPEWPPSTEHIQPKMSEPFVKAGVQEMQRDVARKIWKSQQLQPKVDLRSMQNFQNLLKKIASPVDFELAKIEWAVVNGNEYEGMSACTCSVFSGKARKEFAEIVIQRVKEKFTNKREPIHLVALGPGGCLLDYYYIKMLLAQGYSNITISLIDHEYGQSLMQNRSVRGMRNFSEKLKNSVEIFVYSDIQKYLDDGTAGNIFTMADINQPNMLFDSKNSYCRLLLGEEAKCSALKVKWQSQDAVRDIAEYLFIRNPKGGLVEIIERPESVPGDLSAFWKNFWENLESQQPQKTSLLKKLSSLIFLQKSQQKDIDFNVFKKNLLEALTGTSSKLLFPSQYLVFIAENSPYTDFIRIIKYKSAPNPLIFFGNNNKTIFSDSLPSFIQSWKKYFKD